MNRKYLITLLSIITIIISTNAFSKIQVIEITGKVAYLSGKTWKPLTKTTNLEIGTKISTGIRSYAVLKLNQNFLRIKPLSVINIYHNSSSEKNINTHILLKRGSIRAKINQLQGIETKFKVSTPLATASVRGTEEDISYGPEIGMIIKVISGVITGENKMGAKKTLSKSLTYRQKNYLANPLPLIDDLKSRSMIQIYDQSITLDESSSHNFNGGDLINTTDGSTNTVDTNIKNNDKSKLNIQIIWP